MGINSSSNRLPATLTSELVTCFRGAKRFALDRKESGINLISALYGLLRSDRVKEALSIKGIDVDLLQRYLENSGVTPNQENHYDPTNNLSPLLYAAFTRAALKNTLIDPLSLLNEIWNTWPSPAKEYYAVTAIDQCLVQNLETARRCDRRSFAFEAKTYPPEKVKVKNDSFDEFLDDVSRETDINFEDAASTRSFTKVTYCTNLTAQAFEGKIDPIFGRDQEINRVTEIVTRRKKNNPILLGEPGVGKTAIVEALAVKIIDGEVPKQLLTSEILALDIARFIAGTNHRGDFEQRITNLVEALENNPQLILFVDEIHTLVGGTLGASDAAELLKPALSSGRIRVIGATTHGEYLKYFGKNPAMARRFQPVAISEPSIDDAIKIIDKVIPTYADYHGVSYTEASATLAVELSKSFILDKQLPDKAIDVIDEVGSYTAASGRKHVDENDIYTIVQRMSGIKIVANEGFAMTALADLKSRILGQDKACEKLAKALARGNSGLTREDRAKASILLYGPDATGKRYAATQIAELLNVKMTRLDMTEYVDGHSISRLIGSPPGYVGYGEGGQLSEAIRRNPSSVLFLDKIEFAHPNVLNIILQAIETGFITDSMGNTVSFTGTTVIMSATHENNRKVIGFGNSSHQESEDILPDGLPSGLLEAVDTAVEFKKMPEQALSAVANKHINEMIERLKKKGVTITTTENLDRKITEKAVSDDGSAKAVERAFRKMVEDPILDALPRRGQNIQVTINDTETIVKILD